MVRSPSGSSLRALENFYHDGYIALFASKTERHFHSRFVRDRSLANAIIVTFESKSDSNNILL